jgi:hypothetical protein
LFLDLRAEKADLDAERVESAINDIKSSTVIISLNINPPVKILLILLPA